MQSLILDPSLEQSPFNRITGNPFSSHDDSKRRWERGTIVDVFPATYTCNVATERGKFLSGLAIPQTDYNPTSGAGTVTMPVRGQLVAVHYELGDPVVSYTSPYPQAPSQSLPTVAATPTINDIGGTDGVYSGQGHANYAGLRPTDVLPGDWLRIGSEGNLLGVLEGGVTILKASELAQIIASKVNDMVKLLGRNLEILTDFGEIKFSNASGNTSMSLRAGAKQTTEASPLQENWTIRLDMGDSGQLVNFRVTDQKGHTLAGIHITPEGTVTRTQTGDVNEAINGNVNKIVQGDLNDTVSGDCSLLIGGASKESVGSDKDIAAVANINLNSGTDINVAPGRDLNAVVGRNLNTLISGSSTVKPGDSAVKFTVVNGSVIFDIGEPAAGDTQAAQSGWKVTTMTGDMVWSTTSGNFKVLTNTPNSVLLGGQQPIYHAMLFEMFQSFMSTFGNLIDTHTHLSAVGPTAPPIVPPYASSSSLVSPIQSTYTTLGG